MRERRCPGCGSTENAQVFADANFDPSQWNRFTFSSRKLPEYCNYRLLVCRSCDLVYANPAPSDDDLMRAYVAADFGSAEEARHAARTYASCLRPLLAKLPDREGALDIGAGDGAFLEWLVESGFTDVLGIEPSPAAVRAARNDGRRFIHCGMFCAETLQTRRFRLVTCFQTLEHVDDPLGLCRAAHRLLKEDGAIFVIGHNRRALTAKVLGKRSPIFDVQHLQLFSPRSLGRLLEEAGFDEVEVRPIWNRYPLHYWLRLFPLPARAKERTLAALSGTQMGRWVVPLPAGNLAGFGKKRKRG